MCKYLMFLPETDEEKDFLNKIYFGTNRASDLNQRECLVVDPQNKMHAVSLMFFHEMRNDNTFFSTKDITYKELKILAFRHATGEITLT